MKKEDLIQLLLNPDKLEKTDYRLFEEIIKEYPLFSLARVMQVIAAKKEELNTYKAVLNANNAFIGDITDIYKVFDKFTDHLTSENKNVSILEETEKSNIEEVCIDQNNEILGESEFLLLKNNEVKQDSRDAKKTSENLIDKFINGGHGVIRADKISDLTGDVSRESALEHDSLITDTLAKIYVKQGLYSKAIYAYEKLILKYPIKSAYFATQIEEIKKLINK